MNFKTIGRFILSVCVIVFFVSPGTLSGIQRLRFPNIQIGNIDPLTPGLISGVLTQGEVRVRARSTGSNGYFVTVSQLNTPVGSPFTLLNENGVSTITLFLYKDTSQSIGVSPSFPSDGTQLTSGSTVFNFTQETRRRQFANIKAVMPGSQFSSIAAGAYSGTITMTLTDY